MYFIQLVALIASTAAYSFSTETLAVLWTLMFLMVAIDKAVLKLDWGELFRFSPAGTLLVFKLVVKSHIAVLPTFLMTLIPLHLLGLNKPPEINEKHMWGVILLTATARTFHTIKYIVAYHNSKTKTSLGVPITYPRGLYVNAFWGIIQCVVNLFLILHVGSKWFEMWKWALLQLKIPEYNVSGMIFDKVFASWFDPSATLGVSTEMFADFLLIVALTVPLQLQFMKIYEPVWYDGHKELHETKGGIYVMFHKQHHLNRTPMPSDSCTEHLVELTDIYCWSNFFMCHPIMQAMAWFLFTNVGAQTHNSLSLHEKAPKFVMDRLKKNGDFPGSPLENVKEEAELKTYITGNHVMHHLYSACNYSLPTEDVKRGTLRSMNEKERKAHNLEVDGKKSD